MSQTQSPTNAEGLLQTNVQHALPEIDTTMASPEVTREHVKRLLHSLEQEARPTIETLLQRINQDQNPPSPLETQPLLERIQERGHTILTLQSEISSLLARFNPGNEPFTPTSACSASSLKVPIYPKTETLAARFPLRILVAEDNRINQALMMDLLACFGYAASVVSDGFAVLEILEQQSFDLIFMDIQMPGLNGLETTRQIIARFGEHRPRLIATTGLSNPEDRHQCLKAAMDDYLVKPLMLGELERLLMHWACHFNPESNLPSPIETPAESLLDTSMNEPVQADSSPVKENATPSIHPVLLRDPEQLALLLSLFVEEGGQLMTSILSCLAQMKITPDNRHETLTLLKRNLHQLKGACSAVGGQTLRPVIVQMEQQLSAQGANILESFTIQLKQAWDVTLREIESLQAQLNRE